MEATMKKNTREPATIKERKCIICGKEFIPHAGNQLCCSLECRKQRDKQNYKERKAIKDKNRKGKICTVCGNLFDDAKGNRRFCSKECRDKHNYMMNHDGMTKEQIAEEKKNGRKKIPEMYRGAIRCRECGKLFFKTAEWVYRRGNSYFCTYGCMRKYDKRRGKK